VIQEIRNNDQNVYIIATSSFESSRELMLSVGANKFYLKKLPFKLEELRDLLPKF
jgi:hypothetical protein